MSKIFFQTMEELEPILRSGDIAACEQAVAKRLLALPESPFHIATDLNITNSPESIAEHFDRFFQREAKVVKLKAAYTEMNGFDINPDRWYFDVFAYANYGGLEDYDWLCDMESGPYEEMTITGLEKLQAVYASKAFSDQRVTDQAYMAGLLVVTKFQQLIARAAPFMKELRFPLLATAHDYDFISEVRPKQ